MLLLPLKYKRRSPNIWIEWHLLIKVALLIVCIRIGLHLFSYSRMSRILERSSKPATDCKPLSVGKRRRYIWAVRALSKRMLGNKPCLTQALALRWLLQRCGEVVQVHIGVRKNDEGEFAAHAWLEKEGRVLIGGKLSPTRYKRLKREEVSTS